MRRVGHGGHSDFGQKLLNTLHGVGRYTHKSPIMKWINALKKSSKKHSLKPKAVSHKNASWYTDIDGFLEHSPSRPVLQGPHPPEDNVLQMSPLVSEIMQYLSFCD